MSTDKPELIDSLLAVADNKSDQTKEAQRDLDALKLECMHVPASSLSYEALEKRVQKQMRLIMQAYPDALYKSGPNDISSKVGGLDRIEPLGVDLVSKSHAQDLAVAMVRNLTNQDSSSAKDELTLVSYEQKPEETMIQRITLPTLRHAFERAKLISSELESSDESIDLVKDCLLTGLSYFEQMKNEKIEQNIPFNYIIEITRCYHTVLLKHPDKSDAHLAILRQALRILIQITDAYSAKIQCPLELEKLLNFERDDAGSEIASFLKRHSQSLQLTSDEPIRTPRELEFDLERLRSQKPSKKLDSDIQRQQQYTWSLVRDLETRRSQVKAYKPTEEDLQILRLAISTQKIYIQKCSSVKKSAQTVSRAMHGVAHLQRRYFEYYKHVTDSVEEIRKLKEFTDSFSRIAIYARNIEICDYLIRNPSLMPDEKERIINKKISLSDELDRQTLEVKHKELDHAMASLADCLKIYSTEVYNTHAYINFIDVSLKDHEAYSDVSSIQLNFDLSQEETLCDALEAYYDARIGGLPFSSSEEFINNERFILLTRKEIYRQLLRDAPNPAFIHQYKQLLDLDDVLTPFLIVLIRQQLVILSQLELSPGSTNDELIVKKASFFKAKQLPKVREPSPKSTSRKEEDVATFIEELWLNKYKFVAPGWVECKEASKLFCKDGDTETALRCLYDWIAETASYDDISYNHSLFNAWFEVFNIYKTSQQYKNALDILEVISACRSSETIIANYQQQRQLCEKALISFHQGAPRNEVDSLFSQAKKCAEKIGSLCFPALYYELVLNTTKDIDKALSCPSDYDTLTITASVSTISSYKQIVSKINSIEDIQIDEYAEAYFFAFFQALAHVCFTAHLDRLDKGDSITTEDTSDYRNGYKQIYDALIMITTNMNSSVQWDYKLKCAQGYTQFYQRSCLKLDYSGALLYYSSILKDAPQEITNLMSSSVDSGLATLRGVTQDTKKKKLEENLCERVLAKTPATIEHTRPSFTDVHSSLNAMETASRQDMAIFSIRNILLILFKAGMIPASKQEIFFTFLLNFTPEVERCFLTAANHFLAIKQRTTPSLGQTATVSQLDIWHQTLSIFKHYMDSRSDEYLSFYRVGPPNTSAPIPAAIPHEDKERLRAGLSMKYLSVYDEMREILRSLSPELRKSAALNIKSPFLVGPEIILPAFRGEINDSDYQQGRDFFTQKQYWKALHWFSKYSPIGKISKNHRIAVIYEITQWAFDLMHSELLSGLIDWNSEKMAPVKPILDVLLQSLRPKDGKLNTSSDTGEWLNPVSPKK